MLITLIKKLNPKPSALNPSGGQIMIEALVAFSIIMTGLLGIFTLVSRSISLNAVASGQYVAANLAAEGIEIVKNIVDSNQLQTPKIWNHEINDGDYQIDTLSTELKNPNYDSEQTILFDSSTGLYGYSDSIPNGAPTAYRRKITITAISADEIKVTSKVNWTTRDNASFDIEMEDYFFNWRPN